MKKNWYVLVSILIVFFSCQNNEVKKANDRDKASGEDWFTYVSEDEAFEIMFPGKPEVGYETTPTAAGDIVLHMVSFEQEECAMFCMYSDMPADIIEATDPMTLLEGGRDGGLATIPRSEIIEENTIEYKGYPGIEIEAQGVIEGRQVVLAGKYLLVDNRFYQVFVMAKKAKKDAALIDEFVDSFELKD